jgi:hypothetical protein
VKSLVAWALAIWTIAGAGHAFAQQSIEYASISGRITDPSGAAVAAASVAARQADTNVVTTMVTDQDGRFRFPYLRIGVYEITARQVGFEPVTRRLTLGAGAAFELPLVLPIAGVEATITVSAEGPVLDVARTQIASRVSTDEVASIPLNGRQFLDAALLVPGVSVTNVGAPQQFAETSAVPGISLSIGSQRNLSNNFSVDGLSANDDAAGLSGITYSVDAIQELQVVTSGAQAELGRALGGFVNVVTKSGGNTLRGTVYDYLRDDRLNAANALTGTRLPMNQSQFGGSISGPIVTDRTFYFVNSERRALDQSGLVTIAPAAVMAIDARLAQVGYRGPLIATGIYPSPLRTFNGLAKVDHRLNGRAQISGRYSAYTATADRSRGAGGLAAASAASGLDNRDQAIAIASTIALSARTVLETRGQVAWSDLQAPPADAIGPAVTIAGVASFGRLSTSPTARVNTLSQVVANLSHQAGAHAIRTGVDLLDNRSRIAFPRATGGAYTFASLPDFLAGTYNNAGFTQTFGATEVAQANPNIGIYLQDEWKPGARVTLNLGIRYDVQMLDTIRTDTNNVAPRLGIAVSPFANGRTVVRASAGLYYDRVPLRAVANALLSAGNTTDAAKLRQIGISSSPGQAGAPAFPAVLAAPVPSVTLPNFTTIDRRLQNAHSRQASVEVEQQIGRSATIGIGYQYLRGVDLLMQINRNVPACAASGFNNGCRPNPLFANDNQYSAAGASNYHGLHVSLAQRPARWGSYRVSYTWSTSMNDVGEFFFSSPIDPFDVMKDWGRSDDDQRHRLVVSGSVQTPATGTTFWRRLAAGFQVSGMIQAYSALPLNVTSGATTIQGTTARPIVDGSFIARNSGAGDDFFSVGARVSRAFALGGHVRLDALVEAFNLTNRVNVLARNASFGQGAYPLEPSPTFRQVTAVGDPRAVQLGVRLRF